MMAVPALFPMAQDRRRHAILPDHLEVVNLTITFERSAIERSEVPHNQCSQHDRKGSP